MSISTSSVPGTLENILVGGAPTQTFPGTYAVTADFVPDDTTMYATLTGIPVGNFVIGKASAVFSFTGTSAAYNLKPHPASGTAAGVESPTPADLTSLLSLDYRSLATNSVSSSAPILPGTYTVLASFAGNTNYGAVSRFNTGKTVLISKTTPAFNQLSSPAIVIGTSKTTLSGKISSAFAIPTGAIKITIDGVSVTAEIQATGNFSAAFPTAKLGVGAHTITYAFGGSSIVGAASASGKLTVTLAIKLLFKNTLAYKKGSIITVKFEADDANGKDVDSTTRTAAATAIASVATPGLRHPLPAGSSPGGKFTVSADHATFTLKLSTAGLISGQYLLYFTLSGDSVEHALTFIIA